MLLVELNEFNSELLSSVATRLGLRNIQKILATRKVTTTTSDTYDSGFLEPWVQWVSVHTGVPSQVHGVKNLGDVPNLDQPQIWEHWSDQGRTSIVWGAMNGARNNATLCKVFIPDPWTFSEETTPASYGGLIQLPRYLAKNYLDFSKTRAVLDGLRLLVTLGRLCGVPTLVRGLGVLFRGFRKVGFKNVSFITFFEYLSAMAFIRVAQRTQPDFAILFMNSLAHVQHHYWKTRDGRGCPQIEYVAGVIDELLGHVLALGARSHRFSDLAVMNALSQTCTVDEEPWILHRPKNHAKLLEFIGVKASRVEPLMTYDAHVFFDSPELAEHGLRTMKSMRVGTEPVFLVEPDSHNDRKLFYRVSISRLIEEDCLFVVQNQSAPFHEHFSAIVQRTGKHIQTGDLYTTRNDAPAEIPNHEVMSWLSDKHTPAAPREPGKV